MAQDPTQEGAALYSLDWKALESQGRSLGMLVLGRMCPSCRAQEEKKGSLATTRKGWEHLLDRLRRCCARKADFITPETPILEAAFRLFLDRGDILPLEVIAHEIVQRRGPSPAGEERLREMLARMLERGSFYGFRHHPSETNA